MAICKTNIECRHEVEHHKHEMTCDDDAVRPRVGKVMDARFGDARCDTGRFFRSDTANALPT